MKTDREKKLADQRNRMIEHHLKSRGIYDEKILRAMNSVKREKFIPEGYMDESYGDHPLPIGHGQTISQPYIVALMTQLCELTGNEKVLEIGSGSGYQSAVLSELSEKVFSIERIKPLAERAKKTLKELGYDNVTVLHSDGFNGLSEESPFDVIMITAAPETIPQNLIDQLADGGRLVAPVGDDIQQLIRLRKEWNRIETETITYVRFVPMVKGLK
jgi:protein-L-isoaspartate(D-aspartate) O-methyltransferase